MAGGHHGAVSSTALLPHLGETLIFSVLVTDVLLTTSLFSSIWVQMNPSFLKKKLRTDGRGKGGVLEGGVLEQIAVVSLHQFCMFCAALRKENLFDLGQWQDERNQGFV